MKSKALLLGVFAGLLLCFSAVADAQTKANYNVSGLKELGPENIGGRVSCMLIDGETIYAGTSLGGIFKKNASNAFQAWQFVPCYLSDGTQLTLPVTTMIKRDNGVIYIGTGEHGYVVGNDTAAMASRGRGLWKLQDGTFTQLIDPAEHNDFYFINEIALYEAGSIHRQFAATENGLYTTTDDWATYTRVYDGAVRDLEVVPTRKMLYFTTPGAIHRISNVENETSVNAPVCITSNEPLFAEAGGNVKIAVAPTNATYLYALVFDKKGTFEGVYLSRDQQSWLQLNTSAVLPFSSLRNGENCGTITVDANNSKIIYIGGETIWTGHGYVENSIYQWTKNSYSEAALNAGDYMSYVYNNPMSVHSGIKQILQSGNTFFVATNGGIYQSAGLNVFENISYGLNTVPVVDFAVCPDGSIIMGANELASPFMASRSGANNVEVNHNANIIFTGNGGQPAASRFQRLQPTPARGLILSADGMTYGRTYADYADYTQTQTWTTGQEFLSDIPTSGYTSPSLFLWETMNNSVIKDSLTINIDTLGIIIRDGVKIQLNKKDSTDFAGNIIDSVFNPLPFTIQAGDKMAFSHPSFFGYPFEYTFTEDYELTSHHSRIKVQSPFHSRALLTAKYKSGTNVMSTVFMTWNPMDFRRVWSMEEHSAGNYAATVEWAKLITVNSTQGQDIRHTVMSRNGDVAYAAVSDTNSNTYYILRVRGINAVEIRDTNSANNLYFNYLSPRCQTLRDTLVYNGSTRFSRPVTSMVCDQRDGQDRLVVTFGDYNASEPNVIVFNNSTSETYTSAAKSVENAKIPVFSSMIEYTTGEVYVGTEEGVFVASESSFNGTPAWEVYGQFKGVPVTAIHQQIDTLQSVGITTHNGINADLNVFAKTKFPYAMYFGTYGRGIFMDMKYVTDTNNNVIDSNLLAIPEVVAAPGKASVSIYPNPASSQATVDINLSENANTMVRVFDMSGKVVFTENLGRIDAGNHRTQINCQKLRKGIYIVNVVSGKSTATSKLVVR